jgi:hypothetical protein
MTKIGTVTVVRNATIMVAIVPVAVEAVIATVVSNALSLLPSALLSPLCALTALPLLCVLAAPRLLCVLAALRLLWLLLVLCALRLLLVLRVLCFSSASALFLLSFLCECRNGGSKK